MSHDDCSDEDLSHPEFDDDVDISYPRGHVRSNEHHARMRSGGRQRPLGLRDLPSRAINADRSRSPIARGPIPIDQLDLDPSSFEAQMMALHNDEDPEIIDDLLVEPPQPDWMETLTNFLTWHAEMNEESLPIARPEVPDTTTLTEMMLTARKKETEGFDAGSVCLICQALPKETDTIVRCARCFRNIGHMDCVKVYVSSSPRPQCLRCCKPCRNEVRVVDMAQSTDNVRELHILV